MPSRSAERAKITNNLLTFLTLFGCLLKPVVLCLQVVNTEVLSLTKPRNLFEFFTVTLPNSCISFMVSYPKYFAAVSRLRKTQSGSVLDCFSGTLFLELAEMLQ